MPNDLDVLLVGLDRRDRHLAVEIEVGLGVRIIENRQIRALQHARDGLRQRLRAVSGSAADRADHDAGPAASTGFDRRLVLKHRRNFRRARRGEPRNRLIVAAVPLARRRVEPRGALADRLTGGILQPPMRRHGYLAVARARPVDPAVEQVAAEAGGLIAGRDLALQ